MGGISINQTSSIAATAGVGTNFHFFPPPSIIFEIYPNPQFHSNPGGSGIILHGCIPSLLVICSHQVYKSRGSLLKTAFASPPHTPANIYSNYYYIYINRITKRITRICHSLHGGSLN